MEAAQGQPHAVLPGERNLGSPWLCQQTCSQHQWLRLHHPMRGSPLVLSQLGVASHEVPVQSLGQAEGLCRVGADVVEALGEEDEAGPAMCGLLHQPGTGGEVQLLVRRGGDLAHGHQRLQRRGVRHGVGQVLGAVAQRGVPAQGTGAVQPSRGAQGGWEQAAQQSPGHRSQPGGRGDPGMCVRGGVTAAAWSLCREGRTAEATAPAPTRGPVGGWHRPAPSCEPTAPSPPAAPRPDPKLPQHPQSAPGLPHANRPPAPRPHHPPPQWPNLPQFSPSSGSCAPHLPPGLPRPVHAPPAARRRRGQSPPSLPLCQPRPQQRCQRHPLTGQCPLRAQPLPAPAGRGGPAAQEGAGGGGGGKMADSTKGRPAAAPGGKALTAEQISKIIETLNQQLQAKGRELNEFREKHNIRLVGEDDPKQPPKEGAEGAGAKGGSAGVLVS
uniref:Uncharacterized protein n=1 Tax=Accipiter nisus TaxID=211598 RepID=A0A8B9M9K8_9AVES